MPVRELPEAGIALFVALWGRASECREGLFCNKYVCPCNGASHLRPMTAMVVGPSCCLVQVLRGGGEGGAVLPSEGEGELQGETWYPGLRESSQGRGKMETVQALDGTIVARPHGPQEAGARSVCCARGS